MIHEELSSAVDGIVRGVRARADQVARAEEQLASFAWRENAPDDRAAEAGQGVSAMVVRALRSALDGDVYPVLRAMSRDGDATVADLAQRMDVGRLAAVDRVGAWTQAGLVGRDLETDRVGLTALGAGIVTLVELVAQAAQEEDRP